VSDPVPAILFLLCGRPDEAEHFRRHLKIILPQNLGINAWRGCSAKLRRAEDTIRPSRLPFPFLIDVFIDFIFTLSVFAFRCELSVYYSVLTLPHRKLSFHHGFGFREARGSTSTPTPVVTI